MTKCAQQEWDLEAVLKQIFFSAQQHEIVWHFHMLIFKHKSMWLADMINEMIWNGGVFPFFNKCITFGVIRNCCLMMTFLGLLCLDIWFKIQILAAFSEISFAFTKNNETLFDFIVSD